MQSRHWEIKFYKTEAGKCPIDSFMDTLSISDKEDIIKWIEYLRQVGNDIRRPHGDYLRDKIYELRVTLRNNITRTLFFFYSDDNEIVLTHAFIKKTDIVPENEINKAIKYRNDYLHRIKNIGI